ncbi:MFS general substrate transporter [Myriangium duriaei CBS 260.36]|uniref:MFS general substrate transporter n=1 Tax=Myriangium duriaei CBS 260.36 TaxID=1168546 RepID=A0A9P4IUE1_9PEZI|nr:MFS general substrate transporter [Myriangium duriaei CBS 260.36]
MSDSTLQLQEIRVGDPTRQEDTRSRHTSAEFQLEPTDRGRAAWQLLGTAFVFEALLWGFPLSFGVFQNYYSKLPEYADNRYISVIGTVATGLSYLGAPLTIPFIKRFHKYRRQMIWLGWPLCILGVFVGSFTTTFEALVVTQGVAYGVGFLVFYYPILDMVNEYWVARRGMAYGLLCGASGASGAVLPLICQILLDRFGYKVTLRAMAVSLTMLTGPLIPLLKGRLPSSANSEAAQVDWKFLSNPLFWIYSTSNVLQGLGYFVPSLYIPLYATTLGSTNQQGALLLTLMSVSQTLGQFLFGYLSDRKLSLDMLIGTSTVITGVATLVLWGSSHSFPPLIGFVIIYGFFGSAFTAMWARMSSSIDQNPQTSSMIFTLLCFEKGIGNVLAGPISGSLLHGLSIRNQYGLKRYAGIIFFTGTSMMLSACVVATWSFKLKTRIVVLIQRLRRPEIAT